MKYISFNTDVVVLTKPTKDSNSEPVDSVILYEGLPRHQNDPIPKHEMSGSPGLFMMPSSFPDPLRTMAKASKAADFSTFNDSPVVIARDVTLNGTKSSLLRFYTCLTIF